MNDGIMYVWNVVPDLIGAIPEFTCARKETAEYLCDWCNAVSENMARKHLSGIESGALSYSHTQFQGKPTLEKVIALFHKYVIEESEVIL